MSDQTTGHPQENSGQAVPPEAAAPAPAAAGAAIPADLTAEELASILPSNKDKIAQWVLQQEKLLEALKQRASTVPDVVVFRGYLQSIYEPEIGKGPDGKPMVTGQKHVLSRLYFDLEFNEYIEFPDEDRLYTLPLVDHSFPLSGVVIWLRGSGRVRYVRVVPARQVKDFLGGAIADSVRGNAVPDWSNMSRGAGGGAAPNSMGCASNAAPPICPL